MYVGVHVYTSPSSASQSVCVVAVSVDTLDDSEVTLGPVSGQLVVAMPGEGV